MALALVLGMSWNKHCPISRYCDRISAGVRRDNCCLEKIMRRAFRFNSSGHCRVTRSSCRQSAYGCPVFNMRLFRKSVCCPATFTQFRYFLDSPQRINGVFPTRIDMAQIILMGHLGFSKPIHFFYVSNDQRRRSAPMAARGGRAPGSPARGPLGDATVAVVPHLFTSGANVQFHCQALCCVGCRKLLSA